MFPKRDPLSKGFSTKVFASEGSPSYSPPLDPFNCFFFFFFCTNFESTILLKKKRQNSTEER